MERKTPIYHVPIALDAAQSRIKGGSQAQLAKSLGTAAANLVKILRKDDPQRLSPDVLAAINELSFCTPAERGGMIAAHLHDELVRAGIDPRRYVIRHVEGVSLSELNLSPEMNADIGIIARAAEYDADIRDILTSLAAKIAEYEAAKADTDARIVAFEPSAGQRTESAAEDPAPYESTPTAQILSADAARRAQAERDRKSAASSSSKKSNA